MQCNACSGCSIFIKQLYSKKIGIFKAKKKSLNLDPPASRKLMQNVCYAN